LWHSSNGKTIVEDQITTFGFQTIVRIYFVLYRNNFRDIEQPNSRHLFLTSVIILLTGLENAMQMWMCVPGIQVTALGKGMVHGWLSNRFLVLEYTSQSANQLLAAQHTPEQLRPGIRWTSTWPAVYRQLYFGGWYLCMRLWSDIWPAVYKPLPMMTASSAKWILVTGSLQECVRGGGV